MSDGSSPLVSDDVDLKDFPFTPIYRARLFGSEFHATASDAGWRAGVTLWLKSWDQKPAGSLPADDISLCRLAELGRDMKTWAKVKAEALHGWVSCRDGRLYHKVVAEGVNEAWSRKMAQRDRTEKARQAKLERKTRETPGEVPTERVTDILTEPVKEPVTMSVTEPVTECATETVTGSKRQGQGQGQYSVSSDTAQDGSPDPTKAVFDYGVRLLTGGGQAEHRARSLIGKWRKELGDDGALMGLLVGAKDQSAVEPVSYLTKAIANEIERRRHPDGRAWI